MLNHPKMAYVKLFLPTVIILLICSANMLADSYWVSFCGPQPFEALSFLSPLVLLVNGIANGIGVGAATVIGKAIGENDKKKVNNSLIHIVILTFLSFLITYIIFNLTLPQILTLQGASPEIVKLGLEYGGVSFSIGMIGIFVTNIFFGVLRSKGRILKTSIALIGSVLLNIIIDPILIFDKVPFFNIQGLNLGLAGAASATLIGNCVCAVLLTYLVFKGDKRFPFTLKDFKFNWEMFKNIIFNSIPALITNVAVSFSGVIINKVLMSYGTHQMALSYFSNQNTSVMARTYSPVNTYGITSRIINLFMAPSLAIEMLTVSIVSINYGAKKKNLLKICNFAILLDLL
ncbi:MATE family efflux transporter [Methanobrevibacter acididurans]|uniref:MATE family efflux transporter n=1 Tax=Methanobrevibacter acididurans TaxID=120963 RepID=UPI0038FCD7E1